MASLEDGVDGWEVKSIRIESSESFSFLRVDGSPLHQ